MKSLLWFVLLLAVSTAHAHPSLVPHHHPHGISMLPGLGTFVVGGIFLIALALVAYARLSRR
jgi:uncharacterized membrane protein YkgB